MAHSTQRPASASITMGLHNTSKVMVMLWIAAIVVLTKSSPASGQSDSVNNPRFSPPPFNGTLRVHPKYQKEVILTCTGTNATRLYLQRRTTEPKDILLQESIASTVVSYTVKDYNGWNNNVITCTATVDADNTSTSVTFVVIPVASASSKLGSSSVLLVVLLQITSMVLSHLVTSK
eukprot:scpid101355/ scgid28031/ 